MLANNQEFDTFYNDLLGILKSKTRSGLMIDSMFKKPEAYWQKILHNFSCPRILACEPQSQNQSSFLSIWTGEREKQSIYLMPLTSLF